jgi:hypothetical protein
MRGCQLLKSDQPLDTARGIREEQLCPVAHLCPRSESKWSICVRLSHISGAATRGTARCVLVYLLVYSIALAVKLREINNIDGYFDSRSRSRLRETVPLRASVSGGPRSNCIRVDVTTLTDATVPGDQTRISAFKSGMTPSRRCNHAHCAPMSGDQTRISAFVPRMTPSRRCNRAHWPAYPSACLAPIAIPIAEALTTRRGCRRDLMVTIDGKHIICRPIDCRRTRHRNPR